MPWLKRLYAMTAGIAANRPIAVANKASAMPGATTASDVFCAAAIPGEAAHDAPHRAEQPDERRDRTDRRQDVEPVRQGIDLARHRRPHRRGQPLAGAPAVDLPARGGAPPFRDACAEHLGDRQRGIAFDPVERVDILGLPEITLEPLDLAARAAEPEEEAEDDRPGPDAGEQQPGHHDLHHGIGVQEDGDRRQRGRIGVERQIHESYSPITRSNAAIHSLGWRIGRPDAPTSAAVTSASVNIVFPRMTRC